MKKKMRHFYRFLLLFGCLTLGSKSLNSQNVFDDLFKGFDFDSFLKDMEKAYDDESERKTFGAPAKGASTTTYPGISEKTVTTKAPATKPQSKEELFLTPITQTIQEKGRPTTTRLSRESLNAFKEIMHEFIILLDSVVTKIEGSRIFSMPFKEQFTRHRDAVDKIAITYGTMISKKMYATIMPYQVAPDQKTGKPAGTLAKAPQPAQAANLRKNILDAIKELREIDKELSSLLEDEEKEVDEPILKELSKKKRKAVTFDQALLSKSSKRKSRSVEQKSKQQPHKTAQNKGPASQAPKSKKITEKRSNEKLVKQPEKLKAKTENFKPKSRHKTPARKTDKASIKEAQ